MRNCIKGMSGFKIHPELRRRLELSKNKTTTYFGGTGYYESSPQQMQNKTAGIA